VLFIGNDGILGIRDAVSDVIFGGHCMYVLYIAFSANS